MKKIYLTLLLLITVMAVKAQGPIKLWNDQLDQFITEFNQVDTALEQLYSSNGLTDFIFTYFEPESGNVIKETTVYNSNPGAFINDELLASAKNIALNQLAKSLRSNSKMKPIINEFAKRNTQIVLLYTADGKVLDKVVISPSEILSAN